MPPVWITTGRVTTPGAAGPGGSTVARAAGVAAANASSAPASVARTATQRRMWFMAGSFDAFHHFVASVCRPPAALPFGVLHMPWPGAGVRWGYPLGGGSTMTSPVTVSERDLRTLLGIVGDHCTDLPAAGLPLSLLA